MNRRNALRFIAAAVPVLLFAQVPSAAESVKFVKVISKRATRTSELPSAHSINRAMERTERGEFYAFLAVQLHAKVPSYVDKLLVDRGSFVEKRGICWFS